MSTGVAASAGRQRLAAIVGSPVDHSLSPLIMGVWAEREGVRVHYIPVEAAGDFGSFRKVVGGLKAAGFRGVNVTLPHKENALRLADQASEAAGKAGAANMLTFTPEGMYAENSDIAGFIEALGGSANDLEGRNALLLGAGGAARGVVVALARLGMRKITVANRTRARAERMAADLSSAGPATEVVEWDRRAEFVEGADLVVNATSSGMTGAAELALSLRGLKSAAVVADIVYTPMETGLLRRARGMGRRTVDGLSMLMHQAVPAYKAWLGREAVVDDELRRRLAAAMAKRSLS